MSTERSQPPPSTGRLLKATALAAIVAASLLITAILPAEYGIDPIGTGKLLGLDALGEPAETAVPTSNAANPSAAEPDLNLVEAARAREVFGETPGQSFDVEAVNRQEKAFRADTMEVMIPPGKGAEVKAALKSGEGMVFSWTASAPVAVDMHGDATDEKDAFTTYWIEAAQQSGSGTFVAPFDGVHGWYWRNRGTEPVNVEVEVAGFHEKLFRPGHE